MRAALLALLLVALTPALALACPVCGVAGTRDNWQAYLSMSAMLSILPLSFIGGIGLWIYFKTRQ
ncbi:MAG: hypothetical protein IT184_06905 [Acidobacteria bacterium]|nr:hypothetical protein [Acidobacteriota bacterium]